MSNKPVWPLSMVAPETRVRIVRIRSGQRLAHRLAELGLTPGVDLYVVQDAGGPVLISVHGSRLALGKGMAHKILVTPIDGGSEK